ncbi:MAG: SpoIIE family protein phosphatase [Spirochaetes bacterium]|nr:SpoIIE family protein phosphatase [Spirochaetota bacterium]
MKKKNTIFIKVVVLLVFSIIIVTTTLGIIFYLTESSKMKRDLEMKAHFIRDRLAFNLQHPIWEYYYEVINNLVRMEFSNPELIGVFVYDNDSLLIKGTYRDRLSQINESTHDQIDFQQKVHIKFSKDIFRRDTKIGSVTIYVTDSILKKNLNRLISRILFMIMIITLIIVSVIYLVNQKFILKPLKSLHHALQSFQGENFNINLSLQTNDEFEEIGSSFNSMLKQIQISRDNLKEQERLKKELEIAKQIQTSLLPNIPKIEDLEISAIMLPTEEVGGDYYDIVLDKNNQLWIAIGDVCGHGVTPGLIMMMAETSFNSNLKRKTSLSPKDVISNVNDVLHDNIRERLKETHFMTMLFLKYETKGRFLHSGMHIDMIIYRHDLKKCELVKTTGIYLGIKSNIDYALENHSFTLNPGDILFLYTDGVIESRNSKQEMLPLEHLFSILEDHYDKSTDEIKKLILAKTFQWSGGIQDDDITLIIIKRK